MSTRYQLNITMDPATLTMLQQGGMNLYGFLAVQANTSGGLPLVWYQTNGYSANTTLTWNAMYQAFTSRNPIDPGGQIQIDASYFITPGQVLTVVGEGNQALVSSGPSPAAIGIVNQTTTQLACGICQQQPNGGGFGPVCALPLYANAQDVIVPIAQVFLYFAYFSAGSATVVEKAYSPGILVDLEGSPVQSVSFDIHTGWSGPEANCTTYPPGQRPLLIHSPG